MKKSLFVALAGITLLQVPVTAFAQNDAALDSPERVEHYAAVQPQNETEALVQLAEKTNAVAAIMANDELTDSDLEAIHEVTYSLETAVDKLRETQTEASEAKLDAVDEAVQALHYASENHEMAKTKLWFTKLQAASLEFKNAK